jgi:molybdopterin-biosynthesis enzyme MoeA-like protein
VTADVKPVFEPRGIGAFIIGDEITLGKRADKHLTTLIGMLAARGLSLSWAMMIGDDRARLIEAFDTSFVSGDLVFSFGGIGVTPDDHTRQAVSKALGRPLVMHPEAEVLIRERMAQAGYEVTPERLELGHFPRGSAIVPNPYNSIPGFSIHHHYFLPGFPEMAWPMAQWVLDTHFAHCFHRTPRSEAAILVWDGMEGALLALMKRIEAQFDGLTVFSLPHLGSADLARHIELGVRGAPDKIAPAMALMRGEVAALGYRFDEKA